MRRSPLASRFALTLCLATLTVGAAEVAAPAPPPAAVASRYSAAIAEARKTAEALRVAQGIPGLAAAVVVDGQVVWQEGFGMADREAARPATAQTQFRLASVSKLFTVAAAAKLVEAGKLDVDAPLRKYVPGYPEPGAAITARQLAGHLGGIRHYAPKDFFPISIDDRHFDTVTASLAIFENDPLLAPPGTQYSYTTHGYTLLAAVIEGASGKELLSYLDEAVLGPLKLSQTTADRKGAPLPNRSSFYDRDQEGKAVPARVIDPSYKWAGGGLLSTAADLARFGAAHAKPGFFTEETLRLFFTPQKTADGKETGVGFGWRVGKDEGAGLAIVHHAGNIAGGRSVLVVYRDAGLAVSLLSNLGGVPADVEAAAQSLARPFLAAAPSRENGAAGQ